MNRETRAQLRAARLAEASRKVRDESMRVNAEFAAIEHDPDAEERRSVARKTGLARARSHVSPRR